MKIILASQSPRRKFLMEQMGLKFDTIPSNFEEYFDETRDVMDVVKELGLGKAEDVAKDHPDAIVIGSDLIVVIDDQQIGKPESEQGAKDLLRRLSGRSHKLVVSVAVVCKDKDYSRVETAESTVTFKELSDEFIDEYVATGTTYDKAGGYAIQHPLMRPNIAKIEGRMDAIIGMPTDLLADMLCELDIDCQALDVNDPALVHAAGFID